MLCLPALGQDAEISVLARDGASGLTNTGLAASINDERAMAFTANDSNGSRLFYVKPGQSPVAISTIFGSNRTFSGVGLQSGPSPLAIARELVTGPATIIRSWDVRTFANVILGSSVSPPIDWDSAASFVDINDLGVASVVALIGGSTSTAVLGGSARPLSQLAPPYSGVQLIRPQIANTGEVVFRDNIGRIIIFSAFGGGGEVIAGTTQGFSSATNRRPGISADGKAVGFVGNHGFGVGAYVSFKRSDGTRIIFPIDGEDLNTSFPDDQRVGVEHMKVGPTLDRIMVGYVATVGGVTQVRRRDAFLSNDSLISVSPAETVIAVGQSLPSGGTVTGLSLYDPITKKGDLGFTASTGSGTAVVQARSRAYKQHQSPWGTKPFASQTNPNTVAKKGCYLTALAELHRVLGIRSGTNEEITPGYLNDFVQRAGNHNASNDFVYSAITRATRGPRAIGFVARGESTDNDPQLLNEIDTWLSLGHPVVLHVRGTVPCGHFVLALRKRQERSYVDDTTLVNTYVISDPTRRAGQDYDTLNNSFYQNKVCGYRLWTEQRLPQMSVSAHSPIELMATDDLGRRTGYDSTTGTLREEIPGATYVYDGGIESPDAPGEVSPIYKQIVFNDPPSGDLTLRVYGTGSGSYEVDFAALDSSIASQMTTFTGSTSNGQIENFNISFNASNAQASFITPAGGVNISGTLELGGYEGSSLPIPFELRTPDTTSTVKSWTKDLANQSAFTLRGIVPGTYDLAARGDRWLRRTQRVVVGPSGLTGLVTSLVAGDIDGDNEIAIGDYAVLSVSYGSEPGQAAWVEVADLNGDLVIDIGDYSILSANYGLVGDD